MAIILQILVNGVSQHILNKWRTRLRLMPAHILTFAQLACNGKIWTYGELIQPQYFFITAKLRNNQAIRKRAAFTFPTVDVGAYAGHVSLAAHKPCWCCQSRNMTTLMNSSFFVFNISLMHNYRVKYYDYTIINWCSGIGCNWCASLYSIQFNSIIYSHNTVQYAFHMCTSYNTMYT